ncbi:MAG: type VI secretion system lipoprotein TssJ [Desulfobacterales bacterium]|nr:MAG: type VI secretion system lipoprotein TssJ [Desulfobacterales bacterium]
MMMKKGFVLVCVMMMLAACGFFKKEKPPPPPEPTRVVLEFEAAGDINPNSEGRASPLVVRIYQLKSYSDFRDADFFALYEKDDQVLGKELVSKEEIILKPNEKRTVFFDETPDQTRTIGVLGIFRDYQQAQWKVATGVQPNKTSVIHIYVSGTGLTIR